MRVVVQRVSEATVHIDSMIKGQIENGLVVFLGIEASDTFEDVQWLCGKICSMRIFGDEEGKMNRSVLEINGSILLISQFTLHASTKKGNRPSFIRAARPEHAVPLYNAFIVELRKKLTVETGEFGADMKVSLINDGPVTIVMDSKERE
jgi:D-aminoacyl-tRNA deacylase